MIPENWGAIFEGGLEIPEGGGGMDIFWNHTNCSDPFKLISTVEQFVTFSNNY